MILPEFKSNLDLIVELRDTKGKLWKFYPDDGKAESEDGTIVSALTALSSYRPDWYEVVMWPAGTLAKAFFEGSADVWYNKVGPGTAKTLSEVVKIMPDVIEEGAKEVTKTVKTLLWAGGIYLVGQQQKWW